MCDSLKHSLGNGGYVAPWMSTNGSKDGWQVEMDWSMITHDGTYTVTAATVDDDGARTVSTPITVTLHPSSP
jgi:hypothetical protein